MKSIADADHITNTFSYTELLHLNEEIEPFNKVLHYLITNNSIIPYYKLIKKSYTVN